MMRLTFVLFFVAATGFITGAVLSFPTSSEVVRAALGPMSPSIVIDDAGVEGVVRAIDEKNRIVTIDAIDPFSLHDRLPLAIGIQASTRVSALTPDLPTNSLKIGSHIQARVSRSSGALLAKNVYIWP